VRLINTNKVVDEGKLSSLLEVETVERHYLHATKGWKVDRYSRVRRERHIPVTDENIKRVAQPTIVGERYRKIVNPKHKEAA
jgi:hypothetical protein